MATQQVVVDPSQVQPIVVDPSQVQPIQVDPSEVQPAGGTANEVTSQILNDPNANKAFEQAPGVPVYQIPRVEPAPQDQTPQWQKDLTDLPRQAGSALYGASANAGHLIQNLFHFLGAGADILAPNSLEQKLGIYKGIENWAQQQQQGASQTATSLAGGDQDPISRIYRNVAGAAFNLPAYAVATELGGPVFGMAGMGALETADQGWKNILMGAAQGALQGGVMHVLGPGNRIIRLTGNAAATYANARLQGVDNDTALTNALTIGGLSAIGPGGMQVPGTAATIAPRGFGDIVPQRLQQPLFPNLNPIEKSAIDFLRGRGVPIDVATAAGSSWLHHFTRLVDMSPAGAVISQRAGRATTEGLRSLSDSLMAEARPEVPPNELYQKFYDAANDPANARSVPGGKLDQNGKPVMQDMQMPVPVGILKPQLQPMFDDMQWMPAADRNASAGYRAMQLILQGGDYIPARQAEIGLGGLKTMVRTGEGRSEGIGKFIVPRLQSLIDNAVQNVGGGEAMESLQAGRKAAAQQAGADWLADTLHNSTVEGDWQRNRTLQNRWVNLDDKQKRSMFSPKQVQDLNRFFHGQKVLAENPNPSGSALMGALGTQLGAFYLSPIKTMGGWAISGALSKLMHSEFGIKLLSEGFNTPRNTPRGRQLEQQIRSIIASPPEEPPKRNVP